MAFCVHALDRANVLLCCIDLAFINVVSSDKKGCLGIVTLQQIKDVISKALLWAIVVGECDGARVLALPYTCASIKD